MFRARLRFLSQHRASGSVQERDGKPIAKILELQLRCKEKLIGFNGEVFPSAEDVIASGKASLPRRQGNSR